MTEYNQLRLNFEEIDADHSGQIDRIEFTTLMAKMAETDPQVTQPHPSTVLSNLPPRA